LKIQAYLTVTLPGFSNLANAAVVFPLQSSVVSDSGPSLALILCEATITVLVISPGSTNKIIKQIR